MYRQWPSGVYVTKFPGGYGAVCDAVEWMCRQMNLWDQARALYQ